MSAEINRLNDEIDKLKRKVVSLERQVNRTSISGESIKEGSLLPVADLTELKTSFTDFFTNATSFTERIKLDIDDIRKGAINASREIGGGFEFYKGISKEIGSALPVMRELGYDATQLGEMQRDISSELKTNFILTADEFKTMGQIERLGGDAKEMLTNFRRSGQAVAQVKEELEKGVQIAGQYGVNTKIVFEGIAKMMDDMNQYRFENGVEGMSRMAAKAATMGVGMDSITRFADKIMDPQGAIDAVANFQRLGVAVGDLADPFKLMYMAQSDMEGLTETIAKSVSNMGSFNRETGKMEIPAATRMQMKEMGDQLGLSAKEMNNLVSSQVKLADMSDVFSSFGFDMSDEDKTMIAQLADFNKETGQYEINVGGETRAVTSLDDDAINKLRDRPKDMEDLAKQQFTYIESIKNNVQAMKSGIVAPFTSTDFRLDQEKVASAAATSASEGLISIIEGSGLKTAVNELGNASVETGTKMLEMITSGNFSFEDMVGNIQEMGGEFQTTFFSSMEKVGDDFTTSFAQVLNKLPEELMEKIGDDNIYKSSLDIILGVIQRFYTQAAEGIKNQYSFPSPPLSNTVVPVSDFIIKPLPEDTIKIVDGKIVGGTNIGDTNVNNTQNYNSEALTTIMQPKNIETISSSVLTQIVSSTPIIQNAISPIMESKRESEANKDTQFNVSFSPITIKLEGNGREVELALDDSKVRGKILDMVSDAMTYNYGGKSRI